MTSLHSPGAENVLSNIPGEAFGVLLPDCFDAALSLAAVALEPATCRLLFLDNEDSWHEFPSFRGSVSNGIGDENHDRYRATLRARRPELSRRGGLIPLSQDGKIPGLLVIEGIRRDEWSRKQGEMLFHLTGLIGEILRDKLYQNELSGCSLPVTENSGTALEHYRNFYENAVEGFYQTTIFGNYLRANLSLARMYGYESVDELITESNFSARHLYVMEGRRDVFVETMEKCDSITGFESEVYRRDGSTFWISESARVIRSREGRILFFEGTVYDITRQKMAELELLASRAELEERVRVRTLELRQQMDRFDRLIANVPGMVYQFSLSEEGKTSLIYVSEGIRELYGLSPEEAIADRGTITNLIHPEDAVSYRDSVVEAVSNLAPWHWAGRVITRNQETKWIHGQSKPAYDAHGAVVRSDDGSIVWDGIVIDVTELQKTKHELRRSQLKSSTILELSPDGILTINEDGCIIGINPAAEYMLGLFGKSVTGRNINEIFKDVSGAYGDDQCENPFVNIAGGPLAGRRSEMTGFRADGTPFPV